LSAVSLLEIGWKPSSDAEDAAQGLAPPARTASAAAARAEAIVDAEMLVKFSMPTC
jgi:hypothetical protein